jgi:hypothetical protein
MGKWSVVSGEWSVAGIGHDEAPEGPWQSPGPKQEIASSLFDKAQGSSQ